MRHIHLYEDFNSVRAMMADPISGRSFFQSEMNTLLAQGLGIKSKNAPPVRVMITGGDITEGFDLNVMVKEEDIWELAGTVNYTIKGNESTISGNFPYELKPELNGSGIGSEVNKAFQLVSAKAGISLFSSTSHTPRGLAKYLVDLIAGRLSPEDVTNKTAIGYDTWLPLIRDTIEKYRGTKVTYDQAEAMIQANPNLVQSNIRFKIS